MRIQTAAEDGLTHAGIGRRRQFDQQIQPVGVAGQADQAGVGRQHLPPQRTQRIGIDLARLEALRARRVRLRQRAAATQREVGVAGDPDPVVGIDPDPFGREGYIAQRLPAFAQMHHGQAVARRAAPGQRGESFAAEIQVTESGRRRRIDRVERQGCHVRRAVASQFSQHRLPIHRPGRPFQGEFELSPIIRQAAILAMPIQHQRPAGLQRRARGGGRQCRQAWRIAPGQRERTQRRVPAAVGCTLAEVLGGVQQQEAGAVAVHDSIYLNTCPESPAPESPPGRSGRSR